MKAGRATSQELGSWARAQQLLEEVLQPAIAAIDGLASGGGNEIALTCTLRVGSERAQLQQPGLSAWPNLRRLEADLVAQVRRRLGAGRFD